MLSAFFGGLMGIAALFAVAMFWLEGRDHDSSCTGDCRQGRDCDCGGKR